MYMAFVNAWMVDHGNTVSNKDAGASVNALELVFDGCNMGGAAFDIDAADGATVLAMVSDRMI